MIAPCIGPHIRAHAIGGPACRIVRSPIAGHRRARRADPVERPAAPTDRPRTPAGWRLRRPGRWIRRASRRATCGSPWPGGAQSTCTAVPPAVRIASANAGRPTFTTWSSSWNSGFIGPAPTSGAPRSVPPAGPPGRCSPPAARPPRAAPLPGGAGPAGRLRCRTRADEREAPPRGPGQSARLLEGDGKLGRGIRMRAVAEHDVEQDHRHLRIGGLLQDPLAAQRLVDHRVGAAARERVVAEIDRPCAAGCARRRRASAPARAACSRRSGRTLRSAAAAPRSRTCRRCRARGCTSDPARAARPRACPRAVPLRLRASRRRRRARRRAGRRPPACAPDARSRAAPCRDPRRGNSPRSACRLATPRRARAPRPRDAAAWRSAR